jgi:hypothetical protein
MIGLIGDHPTKGSRLSGKGTNGIPRSRVRMQ